MHCKYSSVLIFCLLLLSFRNTYAQHTEPILAFTQVNVVPMDKEHVLKNQTVLVQGDKLIGVGNQGEVNIPADAKRIEGKGMYLIPGLADMHAHLPTGAAGEIEMGDYLRLNIIRGITTLRSMRGDAKHPALRDSIRQGYITGPTLYLGSPVLPSDKDLNPELAAKLIHQYKQEGFDFIKYLWPLKPAMFDTVLAIAAREGIRVAGHAPKAGLEAALQNKEASVEHIDAFLELYKKDSVKFRQVVHKLGDAGIFSCPDVQWYYLAWNQLALEQLEVRNGMNCIAPAVKEKWEMEFKMNFAEHMKNRAEFVKQRNAHRKDLEMTARMIKAMQEEGIPLLLSPGDGAFIIPGYSMLDECRNFAEAGISPFEVLKAGTVNPASFCHWESGKVEPGKRADLVLLENNPLENVESLDHIQGVMVRGKWFSKDDLEKMEQEIRDRYNRQK